MKRPTSTPSSNLSNGRYNMNTLTFGILMFKSKQFFYYKQIWLQLGVSIVCVIIALNTIQQFLDQPSKKETNAIELGDDKMVQAKTTNYYIYVYGLLLSQGLI
jgi:hypothetical protein